MPQARPSPEEFFSKHAEDYAKSASHAHGSDLLHLIELLNPKPNEVALDVATGTGFTAMELASKVNRVVATDITKEMLAKAQKLAEERGIENISFEMADACNLPYPDFSFDLITSRRAPHHFDIPKFLSGAHRILKLRGRVGIADMSPPDGAEEFVNSIERMRDRSHLKGLTPPQWESAIKNSGFTHASKEIISEPITFERWLYPVRMGGSEEEAIRQAWNRANRRTKDLLKLEEDGEVKGWTRTLIVLIAS